METHPLAYLSSPYTRFPHGTVAAWQAACRIAGRLIKSGQNIYSPIAHLHPIIRYAALEALDHEFWINYDRSMMERCDVLIVAHMDGWDQSKGIAIEVATFEAAGKPIFDLDPQSLTMARRHAESAPALAAAFGFNTCTFSERI
jgi:nucleoside 2-deoxyribosyltransferase